MATRSLFETCRFLVIVLSFAAVAHEISSWTLEGKFHISAHPTYSLFVSLFSNQYFLPIQQQLYETSRPNVLSLAVLYYVKHCRRKQHVEYRSIFLSRNRSTKIQVVNKKSAKIKKNLSLVIGFNMSRHIGVQSIFTPAFTRLESSTKYLFCVRIGWFDSLSKVIVTGRGGVQFKE